MMEKPQGPGMDYREPVPTEVREALQRTARDLAGQLPPGWGFGLLIFSFGDGGTMTYISNANRADMVLAMSEFVRAQSNA